MYYWYNGTQLSVVVTLGNNILGHYIDNWLLKAGHLVQQLGPAAVTIIERGLT